MTMHWDVPKLAATIKELLPSLDYEHLLFALDHPACVLKGVQSLRFLVTVAQELSGKSIPEDLVYQPWKNPEKQIAFLTFLLESPEDLVDFAASPNQIVRVWERGDLQVSPAFFTGEVRSCWTSLDLLQVILQLQEQSDVSTLFRIRIKTAMDLTVLMVALVQLKSRWTEPRRKVMAWVLLQKTISIVKRRDQQLSLTSCMQLFFTTAPNETVDCIVRAYRSSIDNPANYAFFSTLFDACYTIPNFTNTLLKVTPSRGTLRFLVHVLFRDALVPNTRGAEMLRTHMDSLYKVCRDDLVLLLLKLVDEYLDNRLIVIDRPQLAKWTMDYLQYFMSTQSPQIKQQYMDFLQRLQIQGPMPVRVMPQVLFQNWFNLSSAAEKQLFISDLMDIKSSQDGVAYIQSFIEEALKYLRSPTMLHQQDIMSLVELLVLLAKSKLITLDHLDEMIFFVCNACMSSSNSLKLAANTLLEGLRPILKTTPNYLKELVSNPSVQQVPVVYQYLTRILSQTLNPVEAVEPSLSASPSTEAVTQQDVKDQVTLRRLRDLIVAPIKPVRGAPIEKVPEDRIKNRISVLINNVTVSNINNKVDDLLLLVAPHYETWFADYLVRSRCERQTNYHTLYLDLVDRIVKVRGSHLMDEVLRISILVTNELLTSEEQLFMEQHAFLKNLGEWLGILTIGRDVCLSQLHLNLTNQLMIAFYHKRLHYVYEFVCFLLRAGKSSKVIRPPQPWLMALLSLLRELSEVPGIQNQICYLYSNYLNYMGYSPNDVTLVDSYLFLAIPEVKNNRDFTDHASQEEVNMYFFKRYPKYMTESDLVLRGADAKSQMREFMAKATQGASPSYSPATSPLGASTHDDATLAVTLTKELGEVLSREQQVELHEMMEADMVRIVGTYENTLGKYHYAAAVSSVQAMYARDLAQVKDVHEVTEYLDRAACVFLGNLLYSVVPLMERELLVFLHRHDMDMRMMTDARLQALVKLNVPRMMTFTRNRMVTRLLGEVDAMIKEGPVRDGARPEPFPEMTENEKVTDGTLNGKQKAVFTKMADPPSFSDALLSDKAMQEISVRFHYQQISSLVQSIFQHEISLPFLASRQAKEEDIIRDSLQKLSMCFRAIDGKHVPEEDTLLVSNLEDILRLPESTNSLSVPDIIVRIAVLYNRFGLPQIKERLSAVVLERLQPQQYSLAYLPIITLLACNDLLDVALLDRCLQPVVASLVAPIEVHRIVFSCLIDLVLVRELVSVDALPLTMRALEEKAQTEAGKRPVRIDGTSYNCVSMVEKMHAKRSVLSARKTLQAACETEAYRSWTGAVQEAIQACNVPDNVFSNSSRFTELIQALDSAVESLGENAVFVTLYGLLMSCYSACLRVTNVKEMAFRRDYVCTLLSGVLAELVSREAPGKDRLLVFGAELEAVGAVLFQSHDLREPQFLPLFFLRVLLGLVKEVILVQPTEARNEMMLQFATFMRALAPPVVPDFLVSWIQLLSMPQILQLLLAEEVPELVKITGDMVIRLLSFMRYLSVKEFQAITQNLLERITILLKILLMSFPGFLCSRASELVPLVKEDMRVCILNDCPPQCNPMLVRPEEREAFLKRAWEITVERNPVYKQDLQRSMVEEAAENVLLGKNLEASLVMILRVHENRAVVILRPLLQFWVLEEEEVHAKVENNVQTLASENAILELLKVVNYNREYEAAIFNILADYIRFPCKETKLFMETYCGLYCIMDNESKNLMMEVMRRRLDGPNGKYGPNLTLQNMQKL